MSIKVYVKTFGCQMNIRDSEFVAGVLINEGYKLADSVEKADVILFNSCSVRKHAEDRLFSNIADLKKLKAKRPGLIVGLMGCTAQAYKAKALERVKPLDFICGPGNESDIPAIIKNISNDRCGIVATDKVNAKRPELFPEYRREKSKAYISIGEGCNNFCSYCIVPYVRGKERSRNAKDIIREAKDLADRGFKEIMLLGQNVNSYGYNFIRLLEELNKIDGIERIRFMTSHPKDASIDLFKAIRDLDKVCEHLHLPLQSGSDRILKLMNRIYTSKRYIKLAESYRTIVPGGALTTDFITGFPTETVCDFKKTTDLMKQVKFDSAYVFKYSPRPPAKSAKLKDDIPKAEKEARLKAILELQSGISLERNIPYEEKIVEVLVDGVNKKEAAILTGRTRANKVVVFEGGKNLIGKLVDVIIEHAVPYVLKGRKV